MSSTGPVSPPPSPSPDLVDEDPREILLRALAGVQQRARDNEVALAEARHALARLQGPLVPGSQGPAEVARVTLEVAPSLVANLISTTHGPMRNMVMTTSAGAASADPAMDALTRETIAAGRRQLGLYDARLLDVPESMSVAQLYRQAGEDQRVCDDVPTEFCVFGAEAVVCVETWGDPASDYVLIRDSMLIALFTAFFDATWDRASTFPASRIGGEDDDEQLLDLLSRGFKDEAIARYLGWSLRTVRRRVARLMEDLGARTRFQLGAQAVRRGRLVERRPGGASTLPGARLGRPSGSR